MKVDKEKLLATRLKSKTKVRTLQSLLQSSALITGQLIKLNVTANQATILSCVVGLAGVFVFCTEFRLLSILFIYFYEILDHSDGWISRYTETESDFGARLDIINHSIVITALFLAIMFLTKQYFFSFLAIALYLFSMFTPTCDARPLGSPYKKIAPIVSAQFFLEISLYLSIIFNYLNLIIFAYLLVFGVAFVLTILPKIKQRGKSKYNIVKLFKLIFSLNKGKILCTPKVIKFLLKNWKVVHFQNSFQLLTFSLKNLEFDGLICEFGVYKGRTINYIASCVPEKTVYGFDSFKGLPEDWNMAKISKGTYSVKEFPKVRKNIILVVGLFQKTLEPFLKEHKEKITFLHMDVDLYSSTKYVLDILFKYNRIRKGTVIQFDEYYSINMYESWTGPSEYTAFQKFINNNNLTFKYLRIGPTFVSVKITGETKDVNN